MKKSVATKIMNYIWKTWDKNSPAHNFWKRQVKKKKRSLKWFKKNCSRLEKSLGW